MTTLARAPRGREIAAFATLYTAGALSANRRNGLVPCLASSSTPPPLGRRDVSPENPAPRTSDGDEPSSTAPSSTEEEGAVSALAALYLARLADEEMDGELTARFFARIASSPHGATYGATLAAFFEAADVEGRRVALALTRGLRRAASLRWKETGARDLELAGFLSGLSVLLEDGRPGEARIEAARADAYQDGMRPDGELDAILGSLGNHLLGVGVRGPAWFLVLSTFEVLSFTRGDDEALLRSVMLRTIEALAIARAWGPR